MKDLTTGKPMKVIWLFAIPMIIGQLSQQLYNFADSAIVGNYVSSDALAAVGATSVVSNMLMGFLISGTLGLAIPIARNYGAKDYEKLRRTVAVSTILTALATIFLIVLGLVFIYPVLKLLGTPAEILGMADDYVRIIIVGLVFIALYNLSANILRAVGDSKTPLYFLGVSVVLNIGLDLLFIRGFNMAVVGAAVATVISQAVSAIGCTAYLLFKCKWLLPKKGEYSVSHVDFTDLCMSALSMGFMSCIVNIGTIVLQSAINKLGTDIITAHTAARRVFDILTVMLYIVGNAVTTFVSQNMGAGRIDRVKEGIKAGIMINMIITTVLVILDMLLASPLIRLVTGTTKAAIVDPAVTYLKISVPCFYVLGPLFVLRCSMQGMGRKIVPIASSTLEMVFKILSVIFLAPHLGYLGITITEPIIWASCTLMLSIMYFTYPPEKVFETYKAKASQSNR